MSNMRYAIVALAVTAVLIAPTGAFYLPGVAPQDYARVRVWQFFNFFSPFSPRLSISLPRQISHLLRHSCVVFFNLRSRV